MPFPELNCGQGAWQHIQTTCQLQHLKKGRVIPTLYGLKVGERLWPKRKFLRYGQKHTYTHAWKHTQTAHTHMHIDISQHSRWYNQNNSRKVWWRTIYLIKLRVGENRTGMRGDNSLTESKRRESFRDFSHFERSHSLLSRVSTRQRGREEAGGNEYLLLLSHLWQRSALAKSSRKLDGKGAPGARQEIEWTCQSK